MTTAAAAARIAENDTTAGRLESRAPDMTFFFSTPLLMGSVKIFSFSFLIGYQQQLLHLTYHPNTIQMTTWRLGLGNIFFSLIFFSLTDI